MIHGPHRNGNQFGKAGSLFFFVVAILVMIAGAALELLQRLPPLQIGSGVLLIPLLVLLLLLVYAMRGRLR